MTTIRISKTHNGHKELFDGVAEAKLRVAHCAALHRADLIEACNQIAR